MIFTFDTNSKKTSLAITIKTGSDEMMRLIVWDNSRPFVVFTDRVGPVNGIRTFKIRMPETPDKVFVSIYNMKNGEQGDAYKVKGDQLTPVTNIVADPTFRVTKVKNENLFIDKSRYDSNNPAVREFLEFCKKFCYRAGYSSAGGSIYHSANYKYTIRYVDVIIDNNEFIEDENGREIRNPGYGQELATPARIGWETGLIEVSKKHFLQYTIGERMIILLHEFSHKFRNKNIADEEEADFNALKIYLPEGYPRIEAFKAFLTVFMSSPTEQNESRAVKIEEQMSEYEDYEYKKAA